MCRDLCGRIQLKVYLKVKKEKEEAEYKLLTGFWINIGYYDKMEE